MNMGPTKETVKKAFNKADKDRNGKVCMNDFKIALTELAEDDEEREMAEDKETMKMLMSHVDVDGDKKLTCDEFLKLMELGNEDEVGKELMINMIKDADKDGNGFLTAVELNELLLKMNPDDTAKFGTNVGIFINMAATDGEKKLKVQEAILLITAEEEEDPKEKMKTMFRMCDCDGDGSISKKELAKFMNMCDDDEDGDTPAGIKMAINMMMLMADEDQDGKLSYDEFCKIMDKDFSFTFNFSH
eukprot:GFUD01006024.1.p1 GENE.GFUD01006024.1~~GFUD01006024.1.p1  ORF type:complete len:245 (-),score=92.61 GFUD01006024.1:222-956(-)